MKNKLKPFLHVCSNGKVVDVRGVSDEYPKMDDKHLLNTINFIKEKTKNGYTKVISGGGWDVDSFYYDEIILSKKEARKLFKLKKYIKEAKLRGIYHE